MNVKSLIEALKSLCFSVGYRYPNPTTKTLVAVVEIEGPCGPVKIKRINPENHETFDNATVETISYAVLERAAKAIDEKKPVHMVSVLRTSCIKAAALEALLCNTAEFYYCYIQSNVTSNHTRGQKHLVWLSNTKHEVGRIYQCSISVNDTPKEASPDKTEDKPSTPPKKYTPVKSLRIKKPTTISVAGVMDRIGTTTQSIQMALYLIHAGYSVAYIQASPVSLVQIIGDCCEDAVVIEDLNEVIYQGIHMYYDCNLFDDIGHTEYDYCVYDFGSVTQNQFSEIKFLEKDIRILVCGTNPDEIFNCFKAIDYFEFDDVDFIFPRKTDEERKDVLDLMEENQFNTYFASSSPDPFEFEPTNSSMYEAILGLKADESATPC